MLVRRREILSLALVCFLFVAVAPATAATTDEKIARAKSVDRDGYAPTLLARAATLDEIEPNDSLADAQALAIGDRIDALVPLGDEDWFLVDASAEAFVTVSTATREGSVTDTVIDVFTADGLTLLASDDDGGSGLFSAVQSLAASQSLAIRVTRFSGAGDDPYALLVEAAAAPPAAPANDTPNQAEVLASCNAVADGTTVAAGSAFAVSACITPDALGGDAFYRLEIPYSYQLVVDVEADGAFDPALVLFTDPSDPEGSCLAGIDEAFAGERETLLFTNDDASADPLVVYLGVDSWDPQRAGTFTVISTCDFVVDNENTSFGALKARF